MSNQSQKNAIAKLQTAVNNFAKFPDSEQLAKVTQALYECSLHVSNAPQFSTVSLKLKQAESAYYASK